MGRLVRFRREAIPLMRAGNYSQALLLVTSRVASVIAQDAGVQLTTPQIAPPPPQRVEQPSAGMSAGGVVLLIIVILVILFTPLRGILFWMLLSGGGGGDTEAGRRRIRRWWWFWRIWRRKLGRRWSEQQLVAR